MDITPGWLVRVCIPACARVRERSLLVCESPRTENVSGCSLLSDVGNNDD